MVQSLETILTVNNRDELSDWSVVWSTNHVPGMDTATGVGRRRVAGRRRLRAGALALGACLTMHCRVIASALMGGVFVFILFLAPSVAALANPLRHFEVYLGQWSISGPGRAFRIIPMLDGIGIAICINAIMRAICSCTVAAIAAIYVIHSVSDESLPFTSCRDFELNKYKPVLGVVEIQNFKSEPGWAAHNTQAVTVGMNDPAWRNLTFNYLIRNKETTTKELVCKENFTNAYPPIFTRPAYNFFYVEVVLLSPDSQINITKWNIPLLGSIIVTWLLIWLVLIAERLSHGRLIWNNVIPWFAIVPWIWTAVLLVTALTGFIAAGKSWRGLFHLDAKEVLAGLSDALLTSIYIHAASTGSEIIHGKGLNHYASGHIDPHLNSENVWHSGWMLLLTTLNAGGAAVCAFVDHVQPDGFARMHESTLWVIPLLSKCTSVGQYTHLKSSLVFSGLMFSYMMVTFIFLKTALHTIFEYRVKLVFIEQYVVGALMVTCMGISIIFAMQGGIALLESIEAVMTGVTTPYLCVLELVALLHVYRSGDFVSDMNVATEDNTCASRIATQWQIIPILTLVLLLMKIVSLVDAEMATTSMLVATAPLAAVVLAVPLRACVNAYVFLRPAPRRGT